MIEPTLVNPRSEIIEYLIGTLGVDPLRVIELAKGMTASISPSEELSQSLRHYPRLVPWSGCTDTPGAAVRSREAIRTAKGSFGLPLNQV